MPVQAGQSDRTLHSPPVVPDDLETFSHTGVVPTTYAQLNFSEGNSIITGNVSIVAKQANASTTFLEPASQPGVTDVFVSILPPWQRAHGHSQVGAFTLRYGATGEYDEGRYGTPLIARISGVGGQGTMRTSNGKLTYIVEGGVHGQTNKASSSITPDVWNSAVDALTSAIRDGRIADGFVAAIEQCGAVLAAHFPLPPGARNPDELPDKLVEI